MLKYLISPTKTMREEASETNRMPFFKEASRPLLTSLCEMSKDELQAHFKLSDKLASALHQQLHPFQELTPAWYAYQGQQFKALQAKNLDPKHDVFVDKHVGILSGLYGLLSPFDNVGLYRLPLDEGLPQWDVLNYWRPKIKSHLQGETVINLSSKEYRQMIQDHDVIYDVDFVVMNLSSR